MGLETLRRRGPLSALEFLRRHRCDTPAWRVFEARILLQLRDFEGADRALRIAEGERPQDAWIQVERGSCFEAQDRYPDALAAAQEALRGAPDSLAALHLTAHILQLQNRDQEALEILSAAAARLQNGGLVSHLATIQTDLELHEGARASYERVIELSPEMELRYAQWLCTRRSDAAYLCGDIDAAIEMGRASQTGFYLRVAARMEKKRAGRRVQLPVRFVRQHHLTCAPATLSAISQLWQMRADHLQVAEAICYDGTPNHSERRWAEQHGFAVREFTVTWAAAKMLLDRGIAFTFTIVEPGAAHLQAVIGYDERQGVLLVRDPYLRSLVEIDAEAGLKHWEATGPRGMALVPIGRAELLSDLELPDAAERELLFAVDSALQIHDRQRAAERLGQLVARSPGHPIALHARRALANYDGDQQELLAVFDALLALFPGDANLLLGRISSLRQMGRRADCLEALQKGPGAGHPLLWIELAIELSRDARSHAEAGYLLRRAIRGRGTAGAAWHCLADLRWEQRRREEALDLYRIANCLEDKHAGHAAAYFLAARALEGAEDALAVLRDRFQRFGALSGEPACTLFKALDSLQRGTEAFAVLDRALELRPDDFSLLLFSADERARFGEMEIAQALLDRAGAISRGAPWHRAAAAIADCRGDPRSALEHWRTVLSTEPLATDGHQAVARLLRQTAGEEAAIAHLEATCARFPHHYGLSQLLLFRLRQGDPARAVERASALAEHHPADAWARRELALILQKLGRLGEAAAQMEIVAELDPTSSSTINVRGLLLESAHRSEEAREQYRESLRLEIEQPWAIAALIRLCTTFAERRRELELVRDELRRQAAYGSAVLVFQRHAEGVWPDGELLAELQALRSARPGVWETWSASIRQLLRMGMIDDALALARAAADRFALVAGAFRDLSAVHAERRETAAQKTALERAMQISRGWTEPARILAGLYVKEEAPARAREVLESALAAAPLDHEAQAQLAAVLWTVGEKEKAIERIHRALDLEPDFDPAWALLREWKADAAGIARQLSEKQPWNASAWIAVAKQATEPAERLEALARAEQREPRRIDIHEMRATLLANLGRFDEAAGACRPPALGNPAPVWLRGREAWILARRGKRKEAIAVLKELCALEPDYRWGLMTLVELCREEEDAAGLIAAATQALALEPRNAWFHGVIAEARLLLRDRGAAKTALRQALDLDPGYGWAANVLFDAQIADGEIDAAAATLARIEPHSRTPFMVARAVQLAVRQDDKGEAERRFAQVCAMPDPNDWPIDAAVRAIAGTPWSDVLERVLRRAVEEPGSHAQVGTAWLQLIGRKLFFSRLWSELARLRSRGPAGIRATEAYLRTASPLVVLVFIPRFAESLRAQLSLWALAGYALIARQNYRRACRWFADYRARAPQPWMMSNVIVALQAVRRDAEADAAIEFACALPGAEQESMVRLWNAFRLAIAGKVPPAEREPAEEFWLFLHRVTRAAAASADGAPDRANSFAESRRILAAARSPYFNRWLGRLKMGVHARAAARIARARGGVLAAVWGWLSALRS
jgi:tetratricopeptide (TPR) repeat protein